MAQTVSEVIHKAMGVLAFMHMFLVLVLASRGVTAVSLESVSTPVTSSKCKKTPRPVEIILKLRIISQATSHLSIFIS
jgi:hypothetical protein